MELLKIMLVDDEQSFRAGVRMLIEWEKYGFCIANEAEDGPQALACLCDSIPDVIITDIRMPLMSGLEFIERLEKVGETHIVIISGFREFDYARKAMAFGVKHYLLKPIDENELIKVLMDIKNDIIRKRNINEAVKQTSGLLEDKLVKQLLFKQWDNNEYTETCKYLGIDIQNNVYCTGLIKLPNQNDRISLKIKEAIGGQYGKLAKIFTIEKDEILYILCCMDKSNRPLVKDFFNYLHTGVLSRCSSDFCIAYGRIADSVLNIADSTKSALNAAQYSFFKGFNRMISADEIENELISSDFTLQWEEAELIYQFKICKEGGIINEIDNLFREIKSKLVPAKMVQTLLINLLYKLNNLLITYNCSLTDVFGEKAGFQEQIFSKRTFFELKDWFIDTCKAIAGLIIKANELNNHDVVLKVKELIDENYNKDIHLKEIAKQLYFSADYLGRLFKETTGSSFNEYLTRRRIETAKELLISSREKINHISNEVGFLDFDYFTKQFKKFEGKTPLEFRKQVFTKR